MIDSTVFQRITINDDSREIEIRLPANRDDLTITMRQGEAGDSGYQLIYYVLTRRQALIIGQFLTEYGKGESAVDAGTEGGDA